MPHIEIRKAGWLTTVQDVGRWGHQAQGVSVSGPMDWASHSLANRLVRNPVQAATLEVTMGGLELAFGGDVRFAITGAEFQLDLSGRIVPMNRAVDAVEGSVLKFGLRQRGSRTYVAIAGGVMVPPVLGSRATHIASHLGGLDGRALQVGDRLPIGETLTEEDLAFPIAVRLPEDGARVRVLPGPHLHRFPPRSWETLRSSRYVLSPKSDRMGYRLEGQPLPQGSDEELISGATVAGALQVPASGLPILLMADRATTGGYPILAVVISADLPLVGQLVPGDWIEFISCTRDEALEALRKLMHTSGKPAA
ncbi:MAG TPA: biotin-dependent carboxyltransferase family protein [Vicinamibacterales bacterium]